MLKPSVAQEEQRLADCSRAVHNERVAMRNDNPVVHACNFRPFNGNDTVRWSVKVAREARKEISVARDDACFEVNWTKLIRNAVFVDAELAEGRTAEPVDRGEVTEEVDQLAALIRWGNQYSA